MGVSFYFGPAKPLYFETWMRNGLSYTKRVMGFETNCSSIKILATVKQAEKPHMRVQMGLICTEYVCGANIMNLFL